MKILRLILCSLLWPILFAVEGVLWLIGFPIVAYLAWREKWSLQLAWGETRKWVKDWTPRWAFLWGNREDGVLGPLDSTNPSTKRWCKRAENWSPFRRCMSWYTRNPVSNERFSGLGIYLDAAKIDWVGNAANPWATRTLCRGKAYWCWARQGWRAGLWIVTKKGMTYRIGTKVFPGYTRELDRYQGLFTLQRRSAHL